MTLSRLAPQLVVGLQGPEISGAERRLLESVTPAGVILFARNVLSRAQLEDLTEDIQSTISGASGMAPLVMADHEGGRISVLSRAIGTPPSQLATARAGDLELSRRVYRETARRMAACGLNCMLGPVADVNTEPRNPVIGTRSFGDDPAQVAVLVRESVKACREQGLAACIKHFPGHGSTVEDSHFALPALRRAPHELKRIDRPPFGAGIWAGADLVMTGHIVPPDCEGPATLEPGIIVGILREELCYDGVVITDALEMAGIRRRWGGDGESRGDRPLEEIVNLALRAGNDLLLFSRPVTDVYGELECMGELHIDPRSAGRIERLRVAISERLREGTGGAGEGKEGDVRSDPYLEVASRSVEVNRDPNALLPLRGAEPRSIEFVGERADFENAVVREFMGDVVRAFERKGMEPGTVDDVFSGRIEISNGFERAGVGWTGDEGPAVLLLLNRRPVDRDFLRGIEGRADIVVVTDWPKAAEMISDRQTIITTFGIYGSAVEALLGAR